jgi:tRNA threonylcarbamoyl adenosine modification protein (Sua5/YciO/YrdC/YwlC family)
MARYYDVHPQDPQPRTIGQIVALLDDGGLIAYPTDSGYALGCRLGNLDGAARIRALRRLDAHHPFTLVCHDMAQLGQYVILSNHVFRAVKAATPGPYTFILPATREVGRKLVSPKRRTVGVRIPDHAVAQALVTALGEPLMSSTLLLPGEDEPMSSGWAVKEHLDGSLDAVIDAGDCIAAPTTVIDFSDGEPRIMRTGAGDPTPFQ